MTYKFFRQLLTKKVSGLIIAIAVLIFLAPIAGGGFWFWQNISKQRAFKIQFKKIEQQIAVTQKRIEELKALTPEEIAKTEREDEILSAQSAENDVEVAGVKVIEQQGKKIIKNNAQGYSIEVPLNLVIARTITSDWLELHDPETMCEGDPLCDPIIRLVVSSEKPSEEGERLLLNGETVYRVFENIPGVFEWYYYYWSKNDKLYSLRISSFDDSAYRDYIATFKFE